MGLRDDRKRINVTFDDATHEKIKKLANMEKSNMSELVREWSIQGLNGNVIQNNLDVIEPIIREQIKSVMEPMMERMISLTAKTCIQSGTAAYLSAEAILRFVPPDQKLEVQEAYDAARRKAIAYMKSKLDPKE